MDDKNTPTPTAPKEPMSTANHMRLIKLDPKIFAGIRPDMNLLFHFEGINNHPIVGFTGDQGTGKTSLMNCIIALLGGKEAVNSINSQENDRAAELVFPDKNNPKITYVTKVTKTAFSLKKLEETESGSIKTSTPGEAKTTIRDLAGPLGMSPMELKQKKGPEQITFIRGLKRMSDTELKEEQKLATDYKAKFDTRTEVNRKVKDLAVELKDSPYYRWDADNVCFVPTDTLSADVKDLQENNVDEEALKARYDEADKRMQTLTDANFKLNQRNEEKTAIEKEIADLQQRLERANASLVEVSGKIDIAHEFIAGYKDAPAEMEEVKGLMFRSGELREKKNNIAAAEAKLQQFNDKVDEQVQLNADLEELSIQKKQFIQKATPDIEGLEIVVNEGIDNQRPEGVYYKGHSMQELCESELWDLYLQICKLGGVNFMFIENLQSLGSDAIERINWFIAQGYGQVFYTAMVRGQKELKITFHDKL